jgi:MFS family permease
MGVAPPSLWRNQSFMRLWFAQIVSTAGSRISELALPLTAVLVLGATPAQMGALGVVGALPNLIFGLVAGVWVDRLRRQPILIGADLGRALLLGSIPAAAWLGQLTFMHLYLVGFASGLLSILFTIASVAVLPAVVRRDQLVDANSKLELSGAVLSIAGPSAAGLLIQLMSAPKAIIVDAVSYLLSALSLRGVGTAEEPSRQAQRPSLWAEIGEGVRELVRTPLLWALTVSGTVGVFGLAMQETVFLIFITRDLGLIPAAIGLVFGVSGVGALIGAALAGRAARILGTGPAVILGQGLWAVGALLPALAGLAGPALALLVAGQAFTSLGSTIWSINQISLRQHLTPVRVLGRVTAARRFFLFSAAPVGAALGGFLGGTIGLRATLAIGVIGPVVALLLQFFSPMRKVRDLSEVSEGGESESR